MPEQLVISAKEGSAYAGHLRSRRSPVRYVYTPRGDQVAYFRLDGEGGDGSVVVAGVVLDEEYRKRGATLVDVEPIASRKVRKEVRRELRKEHVETDVSFWM